ncbi:hypothetical protein D9615_004672 [Tricholomella constricta]|uniref:MI domain-containing protein n=1 Tax=Tricholomella constricta TaxID=117010 RepID=A0A8H5M4N9_9AGAR|nr:hypothetical protein D9615_004672 [Tricholomella constricta]
MNEPLSTSTSSPSTLQICEDVHQLLDALSMEIRNFISDQIFALINAPGNNGRALKPIIRLIFKGAIDDEAQSEACTRLCREMMMDIRLELQYDGAKDSQGRRITGGQLCCAYIMDSSQEHFRKDDGTHIVEAFIHSKEHQAAPEAAKKEGEIPETEEPAQEVLVETNKRKSRESLRNNADFPKKRPGPLGSKNGNIAQPFPSALSTAKHIESLESVSYPEGIKGPAMPNTESSGILIAFWSQGRTVTFALFEFRELCKEKPDNLLPMEALGLVGDLSGRAMYRGGFGLWRPDPGAAAPSPASVGLGLSCGFSKSGGANLFSMGNFGSASKLSSDERFSLTNANRSVSVSAGPMPFGRPSPLQRTASQGGVGGKPMSSNCTQEATSMVTLLLDALTTENFDSISDELIAWANKSENKNHAQTMNQVIETVFNRAVDEEMRSEMYARLCRKMMECISPRVRDDGIKNAEGKPITDSQLFRKFLLNRCQEDLERGWVAKEATAAAAAMNPLEDQAAKAAHDKNKEDGGAEIVLYSDEYHAAQKAKRQALGLIKFIRELFKHQLLPKRMIHECLQKLLGNINDPDEEEIASLCRLLSDIGASLDTREAHATFDLYFSRMKVLERSSQISAHIQSQLQDVIELRERNWAPTSSHTIFVPAFAGQSSSSLTNTTARSMVTLLLDALTTENFDSISDEIIAWANKSENENHAQTMNQVIETVFNRAVDEEMRSEMYARLCRKMMERISPRVRDDGIKNAKGKPITGGQLFGKFLLSRCQEDFERGWVAKEATAAAAAMNPLEDQAAKAAHDKNKEDGGDEIVLYSDRYYAAQKAKRQGLGLIKFIGELFKLKMLTERIMRECVKKLLGKVETPEEQELESLCKLLSTVGAILDTPKARVYMDVYFSRMKELTKSQNVSARMQFMLQDVLELRERKWIIRNVAAPTTIAQIHEAAAKEKVTAEKESYQRQISVSRGGSRRGDDRGDYPQIGPDGWAVAGGNSPPRPPPEAGDLSNFGKTTKNTATTFGRSSVFAGKKESKRESISRTSSSSDTFSMLNPNAGPAAEPKEPRRKRIVLRPRTKPTEAPANKSESENEEEEMPAEMSEEQAKEKIDEDLKEFFAVRNLDEADLYFSGLPAIHHFRLVDKFTSRVVEAKEADALLLAQFFARAVEKELCSTAAFEEGLMPIAEVVDDIAIDAPKALGLFATVVKAVGLDEERRTRLASKSMDNEQLLALLS